ncbi:MAG TPA: hypothetical protein VMX97_02900 [Hyphomicrobiaceae bacterium]|nr:hypothetical protein [Hyphomicrobiaceae bacterium]
MSRWLVKHGGWWMFQEGLGIGFSVGIHIDWHRRKTAREGLPYGPYVDFHWGPWILSFGHHPSRSLGEPGYR